MALVLVVEDEPEIAEVLEGYLRQAGYRTERAADGVAALALFRAARPDLVLLDINLPGMDGLDVLRGIRRVDATPVVFLTARSDELDTVLGLELGADDYVTKPFSPREVMARVKAVLRRGAAADDDADRVVRVGSLELEPARWRATYDGHDLPVTVTEFRILHHLAAHPGRVSDRAELLEVALPDSDALERVIDTHLKNLRRKLDEAGGSGLLETVRGAGYRLKAP
jgi:two-component system, OmpR family, response regulator AdeR